MLKVNTDHVDIKVKMENSISSLLYSTAFTSDQNVIKKFEGASILHGDVEKRTTHNFKRRKVKKEC